MLAAVIGVLGLGCGSDTPSTQPTARDAAASAACNHYSHCAQIGDGKTFASLDACLTQVKNTFQTLWPPDQCKTISSTGIDSCVTAINIADCNDVGDVVYILGNQCTQAKVCAATK